MEIYEQLAIRLGHIVKNMHSLSRLWGLGSLIRCLIPSKLVNPNNKLITVCKIIYKLRGEVVSGTCQSPHDLKYVIKNNFNGLFIK